MKRFHVHVAVANLEQSIQFYSTFFDAAPTVTKEDYAKWMLDDPRINFAISTRGREPGLDHLGIQVEDADSLKEISMRLKKAQQPILEQEQTTCCYAKADKTWVHDPQGIAWESFHTTDMATTYGEDAELPGLAGPRELAGLPAAQTSACCAPESGKTSVSSENQPISISLTKKECKSS
ncbi:glyoxalase/bleomycin resistance/dioxygenase family protein [bacterium]|jgi:catechol 2,3-dioxygenase-like lactoylglutathione lyase family enzyme|nr:glyoxalase/bleomycin resistance/dioxygenase family protein [bacterium]